MNVEERVLTLPVLPLKSTVLFPYLFLPLAAGRPASIAALDTVLGTESKEILVVTQRDSQVDEPTLADLHTVGTRATIKKVNRTDSGIELLVQGVERVQLQEVVQMQPFLRVRGKVLALPTDTSTEIDALMGEVLDLIKRLMELAQIQSPIDLAQLSAQAQDPLQLVYLFASMTNLSAEKEQALLEAASRVDALRLFHGYLTHEVQVLELRNKIANEAQTEMSKEQRDYVLRQQMRAIQEELGEKNPEKSEIEELTKRLAEVDLPQEVRKEAERELRRLERIPVAAPDFQVIRAWLDLVLELPWQKMADETIDLVKAGEVLDADHYGLEEVKERILEHLAVLKLNPTAKAPILCFVGAPGVGKTSLGQSIARALGRPFERLSLGGMHDEAELRGHRRTYIGAMAGRLIQAIRRAGVRNPVILLDEVDKTGVSYHGDPAAALLEVLDPAQNNTFRDNYLDLPFDLSRVVFLTTANTLDSIPRALIDRMELLRLPGYSEEEKVEIARRYLIPRQLKEAGVPPERVNIPDDTIKCAISRYTREAGVRGLERALGRVVRKIARKMAEGADEARTIGPEDLTDLLGPERYPLERMRQKFEPGVVTGLAWTESGGEVLYVEASLLPGGRGIRLTGQLGKVMRESARAAQSFVWTHARQLGIDPAQFLHAGLHVHVPAGAVPKDGPSAGVAMVCALTSLYTGVAARNDTAMTGEITLSGLVLPIGGVKEKVLAARRTGIRRLILPKDNEADLHGIPEKVRKEMEFIFVERIEDAIAAAIPSVGHELQQAV
jgi:ATP-dependent Lon protease